MKALDNQECQGYISCKMGRQKKSTQVDVDLIGDGEPLFSPSLLQLLFRDLLNCDPSWYICNIIIINILFPLNPVWRPLTVKLQLSQQDLFLITSNYHSQLAKYCNYLISGRKVRVSKNEILHNLIISLEYWNINQQTKTNSPHLKTNERLRDNSTRGFVNLFNITKKLVLGTNAISSTPTKQPEIN